MYRAIRQATTPTMFPRKLGNGSKGRITTAIHDQLSAARLRVNQDSTAPRHRQFVSPLVQYRNSRACVAKVGRRGGRYRRSIDLGVLGIRRPASATLDAADFFLTFSETC